MTHYEVIVKATPPDGTAKMIFSGMSALSRVIDFLDERARAGQIGGVDRVRLYDSVIIGGDLLDELIADLGPEVEVQRDAGVTALPYSSSDQFSVYLSEV